MYDFYFTFRSMTAAQQAALTLLQFSVDAEFVRAPRQFSQMGCGYAVRTRHEDAYRAGMILRQQGISFERGIRWDNWAVGYQ